MKKRLLSLALALVIVIGLLPLSAFAANGGTSIRENFLRVAASQVGYRENYENITKYGRWYGMNRQPWCAMFVSWCARMSGVPESEIPNFAACNSGGVSWFKKHNAWKYGSYTPLPGDIVFFDFDEGSGYDGRAEHVGIVESVDDDYVYTIEGNTSNEMVERKQRPRDRSILGYGTPQFGTISYDRCDMSLENASYPNDMWEGTSHRVTGTVRSDYAIKWLYADLRDGDGNFCGYGYCSPGTTTASLETLSGSLKFSSLSTGRYYLYVEAIDYAYNLKIWKLPFTVYGSGYEVKFDANGGENAPKTQIKHHGVPLKLSSETPQRSEYIFLGWAESPTAETPKYAPGGEYAYDLDVTLWAVWKKCDHSYKNAVCTVCGYVFSFPDVNTAGRHAPFADAIVWAVDGGITTGYTDGTFRPDIACTRAQVATFLWRASGCPEPKGTAQGFTDVKNEGSLTPYYKAILWAAESGITTGYDDGTFRPFNNCSRAQFVTMLWRAAGCEKAEIKNPFSDVSEGVYFDAIMWAYANGVTVGYGNGEFGPYDTCTRAETLTFIYRHFA